MAFWRPETRFEIYLGISPRDSAVEKRWSAPPVQWYCAYSGFEPRTLPFSNFSCVHSAGRTIFSELRYPIGQFWGVEQGGTDYHSVRWWAQWSIASELTPSRPELHGFNSARAGDFINRSAFDIATHHAEAPREPRFGTFLPAYLPPYLGTQVGG